MNEKAIIDYIESPCYARSVLGLSNTELLLDRLGRPDEKFQIIHIAGTNGKGSTAAMVSSILQAMGKKVGLYTSPYLTSYFEKIRINGEFVSRETFIKMGEKLIETAEQITGEGGVHPTSFEMSTALALLCFWEEQCDIAVIEVGLGGRLDATNAIKSPLASVITHIGLDHTEILGDTIEMITAEKCGILKPGTKAVVSPENPQNVLEVVKEMASERQAPLIIPEVPTDILQSIEGTTFSFNGNSYCTPLLGKHQAYNAVTAISAVRAAGFSPEEGIIKTGLLNTRWEGRLERLPNEILIDGAHNPQGAKALADSIEKLYPNQKVTLLFGMLRDKEIKTCYETISPYARKVVLTEVPNPRTADEEDWEALTGKNPDVTFVRDYKEALKEALRVRENGELLVICGSLYLIGAIRPLLSHDF